MIDRQYNDLGKYLKSDKVLVIFGPRRVGKTTLIRNYLNKTKLRYKLDNGDNIRTQQILSSSDFSQILPYLEGYELYILDEAQRVSDVGLGLKIIVDNIPGIKVIATGSSSFDLSGQIGEPLTGRKTTLKLYPIAQLELKSKYNQFELKDKLEEFLVYGSYPEIITSKRNNQKREYLEEIVNSYLFKDILDLEEVKGAKVILDLLRLIAFQIGSEVSYAELGASLGIDRKTVMRYLDLLEKSFVLYNLRGLSRNLRKEIYKKSKYYFWDNGIRNALISNFNTLGLRDDVGRLWENFLIIERLKKKEYFNISSNNYFWRTWDQKELDLVEEREGKFFGYEFKYTASKFKFPKDFTSAYPNGEIKIINRENYQEFVMGK